MYVVGNPVNTIRKNPKLNVCQPVDALNGYNHDFDIFYVAFSQVTITFENRDVAFVLLIVPFAPV